MLLLSKYLELEEEFEENGIFDIALDMDSNYFINVKLLEKTTIPEFKDSYKKINNFFREIYILLKNTASVNDRTFNEAKKKFNFPEKIKIGLGYSKGTTGTGLTGKTALKVLKDAKEIIDKGIREPEIFHLIGLFEEGIGPDRLSDMYSLIIKDDIINYTMNVNKKLLIDQDHYPEYKFKDKILINPKNNKEVFVLPKEILHELPIAYEWEDIECACEKIRAIRNEINSMIGEEWSNLSKKEKQKVAKKEIIFEKVMKKPSAVKNLIDEFKEYSIENYDFDIDKVGDAKIYRFFSREFDQKQVLDRVTNEETVENIVIKICDKFKDLVENNSISKLLYNKDKTFRGEKYCQLLFFAVAESYCEANNLDISPETNSGRGSIDFKFNKGYSDRVIVELKLTSNPQLCHGITTQIKEYEKAEKTNKSIYVVIDDKHTETTIQKLNKTFNDIKEQARPRLVVIDPTIKASASVY